MNLALSAASNDSPSMLGRVLRLAASDRPDLLAALDTVDLTAPPSPPTHDGPGPRLSLLDPTPQRLAAARRVVVRGHAVRRRPDLWFSPQPLLTTGGGIGFLFPGLEGGFAPRIDDLADWLGMPTPELSTASLGRHGHAVLAVGRLLDTAMRRLAVRPDAVAGHSVGEWAAMIAGGIVSGGEFDAMISRVDLDSLQVPGVQFAVLGCPADQVRAGLTARPDLVISHENSTNQTVICGPERLVAEALVIFRARAVICRPLPFRSGFHTPMLAPFLDTFRAGVPNLPMRAAHTPVWSATTATVFPDDPIAARDLCLRHLLEPVRFRQLVRALYEAGVRAFVQLGSGQLGSLVEDTLRNDLPGADFVTVAANSAHRSGLDQLLRCALALWTEGAEPDLALLTGPVTAAVTTPALVPVEPAGPVLGDHAPAAGAPHRDRSVSPPAAALDPAGWPGLARLTALGARMPIAAQLSGFLDDTAEAVADVLDAASRTEHREALNISLAVMPYLRDHCLMRQRPHWPDEEDLRAVLPATTMVAHLSAAAERAFPGLAAVAVENARFHRWLAAVPAHQVTIEVRRKAADRVWVRLGEYAEAVVRLGPNHRPSTDLIWPAGDSERSPHLTAEQLYRQRWLFHGPAFQGLAQSVAVSDCALRGLITVPAAPGALLDNLGQFLGQWLVEHAPQRWIALPARIERIDWHGPEPAPGSIVECRLRVTGLDHDTVVADGQLAQRGIPVVTVRGWTARRFDSDERAGTAYRMPGTATLSERHPQGWWWVAERWHTLASREFYLHRYAGHMEYAEYELLPPADRRAWLLTLIAIKDAVRGWLWERGAGPIYPAELRVQRVICGSYRVTGAHGLDLPDLDVATAQHAEVAVALVRPAGPDPRPAIRVTEVAAGPDSRHITNPAGLPARSYRVWTS